ncbi:MAG: HAMP domain-containing sensor histidine kinase [Sulfurospirillaceae bacterium]|nr:HAMP domain-containing sensor histidine kinase [Sulfurospirillaceae bacterium]
MERSRQTKLFKLFQKHYLRFEEKIQNEDIHKAYKELKASYASLTCYNNLLEERIEKEIQKQKVQEELLARQTRLAAMGEMMDAVAHQWAQPLSIIDMNVNLMTEDFKNNLIDKKYIEATVNSINLQTKHLKETLKKFRTFFNPVETRELFSLNTMIKETLTLLHDEMLKQHIDIKFTQGKDSQTHGSINEIKHVLINLINNAKDAFNKKKIQERYIHISIEDKPLYLALIVQDNAGGIDEHIIQDIFKPYISTKQVDENSGIGLYMSQLIIEKYNGHISAQNKDNGAEFTIKFYKE